jgi:probable addiction module antidote protein
MRDQAHDDVMAEIFRKDPAYAVELLNNILEDGDHVDLLVALRQMTKAFGGTAKIAQKAKLNRTQLYRTLSRKGNPEIRSVSAILRSMGMRLAVQPIKQRTTARARRPAQGRSRALQ